jgi:hypothetical protein
MSNDTETTLYFNGINGATGDYDLPPLTSREMANVIKGEDIDTGLLNELKRRLAGNYAIEDGKDPSDIGQSGWGYMMAYSDDPAVKRKNAAIQEALSELIQFRKEQAGARFKEYTGGNGFRPTDTKNNFISRNGLGPGPVMTDVMPYYLLIVGDPDTIPFRFQNQLDIQFAVGRIYFDTLEEYAQYARSVVQAEKGHLALARQAAFFGVKTSGDQATQLSAEQMVRPLAKMMADDQPDWNVRALLAEQASKAQLAKLLGGAETPALLYTAGHGMGFPNGDKRQLPHQGALLCQDWPGPGQWKKPIPQDFYFSADDVGDDAKLLGLIAFFFACYGAGTPKLDEFTQQATKTRAQIAPNNFLSSLPRRLLSHPKGGALAVVGHVERAWGYSFMWDRAGSQLGVFRDAMKRLMEGKPIGYALESFNQRYAELSAELTPRIEDLKFDVKVDENEVASLWMANNDARAYVIIGDPAVRAAVAPAGAQATERPAIKPVTITSKVSNAEAATPAPTAPTALVKREADEGAQKAASFDALSFSLGQEGIGLGESLKRFTSELAGALGRAADDISSLEVSTYTSPDLDGVKYDYDSQKYSGNLRLRALTRIAFDGDMQVCVPEKDNGIDQALWQVHLDMVKEAQANRAEFLKSMAEMATRLIEILKP